MKSNSRHRSAFLGFLLTLLLVPWSGGEVLGADLTKEIVVTNSVTLDRDTMIRARLVVRASHVTIDGNGATLIGTGTSGDLNSLEKAGIGVSIEGVRNVVLKNLTVRGFATGLVVRDAESLVVEGCNFSDNYHNPKHGWGELPARGGILMERVKWSVVRQTKANRVWDGLHLVDSDENLIEDNDFSFCSNTCAKLWHSRSNRFLGNNLSYGIRIDRAAGEVHARDSTSVLIETGSDGNYWFRNDVTHGGDGIFIRVLNGWVSTGNVFVENDTSYANNNCVESWSPGNTFIRNKANHGSYGFWMGGSDGSVLIGNEAGYNGLTNGYHNAPEPGFGHGGIVFVSGSSSHTILSGNWAHHNNGGGIVLRGDVGSRGQKWRAFHWLIQENRLESNRWGVWGRWADSVHLVANSYRDNEATNHLQDVTNLVEISALSVGGSGRPIARLSGPRYLRVDELGRFDASSTGTPGGAGGMMRYHWSDGSGSVLGNTSILERTFGRPGLHRVALTVDNGLLADLAWNDVIVTEPVGEELGTDSNVAEWGFELENNSAGTGKVVFEADTDALAGRHSIRFAPNPYPGFFTTVYYPKRRDANWDFSKRTRVRFWLKARNPNLPGFQNAGPVLWLYGREGKLRIEPAKGRNLLNEPSSSEARWAWSFYEIPLANDPGWIQTEEGRMDRSHVTSIGLALDSWGGEPFAIWLDGLEVR